MSRRTTLTGLATGLGIVTADWPLACPGAALEIAKRPVSSTGQRIEFAVPFGPGGQTGETPADQAYIEP